MEERYIELKKGNTTVVVDRVGAQVVSIKVNGIETMYQGALDPKNSQWKATAKNLSAPGPVGTSSPDGELEVKEIDNNGKKEKYVRINFNGAYYWVKQHGSIQDEMFDYLGDGVFRASYFTPTSFSPFKCKYFTSITIENDGVVNYEFRVVNIDDKPILAGLGWHPAFQLKDDVSRYSIVFENLVTDGECEVEEGKEYEIDSIVSNSKSVKVGGIKSVDVVLMYTDDNGKKIRCQTMHSEEPYIILWSKKPTEKGQQNFICVEPWNTTPRQINNLTTQDKIRELEGNGAVIINPGEEKVLSATISFNDKYLNTIESKNNNRR